MINADEVFVFYFFDKNFMISGAECFRWLKIATKKRPKAFP